jgi:hypothetical protein
MGGPKSKEFARTPKAPNLRDKLSAAFLQAFSSDFEDHGVAVIEALREKYPEKYAELCGRIIATVTQPLDPNDYAHCQSEEEIVRKMLVQIGMDPDGITPDMLRQAEEANTAFIARLLVISEGN